MQTTRWIEFLICLILSCFLVLSGRRVCQAIVAIALIRMAYEIMLSKPRRVSSIFLILALVAAISPVDFEVRFSNKFDVTSVVVANGERRLVWLGLGWWPLQDGEPFAGTGWRHLQEGEPFVYRSQLAFWPPLNRCVVLFLKADKKPERTILTWRNQRGREIKEKSKGSATVLTLVNNRFQKHFEIPFSVTVCGQGPAPEPPGFSWHGSGVQ